MTAQDARQNRQRKLETDLTDVFKMIEEESNDHYYIELSTTTRNLSIDEISYLEQLGYNISYSGALLQHTISWEQ